MAATKSADKQELHGEVYYPSPEVISQANVSDPEAARREAAENLAGYWARRAGELEWFQKWDTVLDESNKPFYKWFVGGEDEYCFECARPSRQIVATEQAGVDLGRREGGTPDDVLFRIEPRSV